MKFPNEGSPISLAFVGLFSMYRRDLDSCSTAPRMYPLPCPHIPAGENPSGLCQQDAGAPRFMGSLQAPRARIGTMNRVRLMEKIDRKRQFLGPTFAHKPSSVMPDFTAETRCAQRGEKRKVFLCLYRASAVYQPFLQSATRLRAYVTGSTRSRFMERAKSAVFPNKTGGFWSLTAYG
jgi:hypothetical protein